VSCLNEKFIMHVIDYKSGSQIKIETLKTIPWKYRELSPLYESIGSYLLSLMFFPCQLKCNEGSFQTFYRIHTMLSPPFKTFSSLLRVQVLVEWNLELKTIERSKVLKLATRAKFHLWTIYLMEMMIALNFTLWERR